MEAEVLDRLIEILCRERNKTPPRLNAGEKPDYFRALCNIRPPLPVSEEFLALQNLYLSSQTRARGIVEAEALDYRGDIALWRGDITRLKADAIVNACNSALLGCFQPLHGCIDNVVHSSAGVQVRLDCASMMRGGRERNGSVRVTKGYNLSCRYIFHTVGPMPAGKVTERDESDLKNCYVSCLNKANELNLRQVAFCCISTGVYGYPKEDACALAVRTVKAWKGQNSGTLKIIFDVFSEEDERIYAKELRKQA